MIYTLALYNNKY